MYRLTTFIFCGLILLIFWIIFHKPNSNFTSEKWLSRVGTRYEISDDLIKRKILIGKTKPEIQQLLGEGKKDKNRWTYYIGTRAAIGGFDPYVLDVLFQEGKAIRVEQHED